MRTFLLSLLACSSVLPAASARAQSADPPRALARAPVAGASAQRGTARGGRVIVELLSGAAGEALFGLGGALLGGMTAPANHPQSSEEAWTRVIVGGSVGGSLGAALGVAVVGDALGGDGSWGFTFAAAGAGGIAGALTWTALDTNSDTIAFEALAWLGLPLAGAVLGYELSAPADEPRAPMKARAGPRLRAASVQPTPDRSGAVLRLAGTF